MVDLSMHPTLSVIDSQLCKLLVTSYGLYSRNELLRPPELVDSSGLGLLGTPTPSVAYRCFHGLLSCNFIPQTIGGAEENLTRPSADLHINKGGTSIIRTLESPGLLHLDNKKCAVV